MLVKHIKRVDHYYTAITKCDINYINQKEASNKYFRLTNTIFYCLRKWLNNVTEGGLEDLKLTSLHLIHHNEGLLWNPWRRTDKKQRKKDKGQDLCRSCDSYGF